MIAQVALITGFIADPPEECRRTDPHLYTDLPTDYRDWLEPMPSDGDTSRRALDRHRSPSLSRAARMAKLGVNGRRKNGIRTGQDARLDLGQPRFRCLDARPEPRHRASGKGPKNGIALGGHARKTASPLPDMAKKRHAPPGRCPKSGIEKRVTGQKSGCQAVRSRNAVSPRVSSDVPGGAPLEGQSKANFGAETCPFTAH